MAVKNWKQQILESALRLGDEQSWDQVRLYDIAKDLNISLVDIQRYYSQKDDLVEAWFDGADQAVLELKSACIAELPMPERLHKIIFTWFDSLAQHKRLVRQMLHYKLEPLHTHLQFQGVLRVSRTVQWFLESAGVESTNPRRIIDEIGLTSMYLATLSYWLMDNSDNQENSRAFLTKKLELADKIRSIF